MKIKVKFAEHTLFPSEYKGQEVEVSIESIKLPNGTFCCVDDTNYRIEPAQETQGSQGAQQSQVVQGLPALFGQELKSLTVDFK